MQSLAFSFQEGKYEFVWMQLDSFSIVYLNRDRDNVKLIFVPVTCTKIHCDKW